MKTFIRFCAVSAVLAAAACGNSGKNASLDAAARQKITARLLSSASNNDINGMLDCIDKGADPDAKIDFWPILTTVVGKGYYEVAADLLKHGANPNTCDNSHLMTPLGLALNNNNARMALLLISNGADVDMQSSHNYPAHMVFNSAIYGMVLEPVIIAIMEKTKKINVQDSQGMTPLHYAILITNTNIIGLILKRGGKKDIPTVQEVSWGNITLPPGTTPLKLADIVGNPDVIRMLKQ